MLNATPDTKINVHAHDFSSAKTPSTTYSVACGLLAKILRQHYNHVCPVTYNSPDAYGWVKALPNSYETSQALLAAQSLAESSFASVDPMRRLIFLLTC